MLRTESVGFQLRSGHRLGVGLLAIVLAACADPAGAARSTKSTFPVQCSLNQAPAVDCQMSDEVRPDGNHDMQFVFGGKRVRFSGKAQTGWWSGELDGDPAMGFERNRGHTTYSTTDLKTSFEWWSKGSEHGSY